MTHTPPSGLVVWGVWGKEPPLDWVTVRGVPRESSVWAGKWREQLEEKFRIYKGFCWGWFMNSRGFHGTFSRAQKGVLGQNRDRAGQREEYGSWLAWESGASCGKPIEMEIMGIIRVCLVDLSQIVSFCGFALRPWLPFVFMGKMFWYWIAI